MPIYQYSCDNPECECDTFETYQSIKEGALKICPYCQTQSIERVIHSVYVFIRQEPKTLGSLADANRKRLGESYCQEQEQKIREERLSASEFVGKLPKGASKGPKRIAMDTPWRKANEPVDLSLAKMNKEQKQKYIMTGKKP
jgi:putative FmdB family regulatory protein